MQNVGFAALQIVPTMKGARAAIGKELGNAAPQAQKAGTKMGSGFASGFAAPLKAVGAVAATSVLAATAAVTAFGAKAISAGIEFNTLGQTSRAALTTLLGSSKAANKQMDRLDAFAKKSPFAKQVFISAQQQMIGFGFAAKDVLPTLNSIQDAVAATGGSGEQIGEIANILATVKSTGKITGDTLNQLGYRGIDAARLIGDSLGRSGNDIRTSITEGALKSNVAIKALVKGMNREFGGASVNVKKTWIGATDRIKGATRDIGSALVEPFISKKGGGIAVGWANSVATILRGLIPHVEKFAKSFSEKVGPTITKALAVAEKFSKKGFDTKKVEGFVDKIKELGPILAPLAGLLAGKGSGFLSQLPLVGKLIPGISGPFGLLVGLFATMVTKSPELQKALFGVLDAVSAAMTQLGPSIEAVLPALSAAIVSLGDSFAVILVSLTPVIPVIADLIVNLLALADPLLQNETLMSNLVLAFIGYKAVAQGLKMGKAVQGFADTTQALLNQKKAWAANQAAQSKSMATTLRLKAMYAKDMVVALAKSTATLVKNTAGWVANKAAQAGSALASGAKALASFTVAMARQTASIVANTAAWVANKLVLLATKAALVLYAVQVMAVRAATVLWTGVQWLLNAAMAANPIVWVVIAIVALIAVIVLVATKTKFFQKLWAAMWSAIKTVWTAMLDWFKSIGGTLAELWRKGWQKVKDLWNSATAAIKNGATRAWDNIVKFFKGIPKKLLWVFQNFTLPGLLLKHWNSIKATAIRVWNAVVSWVKGIPGRIANNLRAVGGLVSKIWNSVKTKAIAAWDKIKSGVTDKVGTLMAYVRELPGKVLDGWKNIGSDMLNVGKDIISGLINGLRNAAGSITDAVQKYIIDKIPGPVKKAFGISSPSKVFKSIGRDLIKGLALGIAQETATVVEALKKVSDLILKTQETGIKNEAKRLMELRRKANASIARWNRQHKGTKNDRETLGSLSAADAEKQARKNMAGMMRAAKLARQMIERQQKTTEGLWGKGIQAGTERMLKALSASGKWNRAATKTMRSATLADIAKARSYMKDRIDAATTVLEDMRNESASLSASIKDTLSGEIDIGGLAPGATFETVASHVSGVASRIRTFAGKLKDLAAKGIPPGLIQEVANLGSADGIPVADALMTGTRAQVKSLAADWSSIDTWAESAGNTVAKSMFGVGIAAQEGIVKGLLADDKKLKQAAERIADSLTKAVKKKLGIKSPSTVFEKLGALTVEGFALGIERNAEQVADAFGIVSAQVVSQSIPLQPNAVGYRPPSTVAQAAPQPIVYVQNPFTGEYLLATMDEVADVRSQAAVLSASRARAAQMRSGRR